MFYELVLHDRSLIECDTSQKPCRRVQTLPNAIRTLSKLFIWYASTRHIDGGYFYNAHILHEPMANDNRNEIDVYNRQLTILKLG